MKSGIARLLLAAVPCLLLSPGLSLAVITGADTSSPQNNTTLPGTPTGLSNEAVVLAINEDNTSDGYAGGIYLGDGWMMTAYHVVHDAVTGGIDPTIQVQLNGDNYTGNGDSVRLVNPSDDSPTDLVMFHLNTIPVGLPTLTIPTVSPSIGTGYYNMGFGGERTSGLQGYDASFNETNGTPTYQGYEINSYVQTFAWGQNQVYGFQLVEDGPIVNTFTINEGFGNVTVFGSEFVNSSTSDQIVPGDSGGGAITSGNVLLGINDAGGEYAGQPDLTEALFGDQSYMVDVATYSSQIDALLPEPTGAVVLGATLIPLLLRRRRKADLTSAA